MVEGSQLVHPIHSGRKMNKLLHFTYFDEDEKGIKWLITSNSSFLSSHTKEGMTVGHHIVEHHS